MLPSELRAFEINHLRRYALTEAIGKHTKEQQKHFTCFLLSGKFGLKEPILAARTKATTRGFLCHVFKMIVPLKANLLRKKLSTLQYSKVRGS